MATLEQLISTGLQVASVIPGSDIVGVFDQTTFQQLFQQARPMKMRVREKNKLFRHPLETGATITDHKIILPVEIEMDLMLTNGGGLGGLLLNVVQGNGLTSSVQSLYRQIKTYSKNGTLVQIQARSGTYMNMVIEDIDHPEVSEMFDTLLVKVLFTEAQFVTAQYATLPPQAVKNPADASTQQIGQQSQQSATQAQAAQAGIIIGNYSENLTIGGGSF